MSAATNGTVHAAARHALPIERPSITHKFCCTGDTLVATADGRNVVSLERLALEKESVSVYAAEPCVVKRASGAVDTCYRTTVSTMRAPRLTRSSAAIVRVVFDDGSSLRCTPDHELMLADGSFLRADHLYAGASMARFDSEVASYGNGKTPRRRVWLGLGGGHKNGQEWRWQHRWIGKRMFGDWSGSGLALHHVNENPLDDRYDNLELKDRGQHASEHKAGARNPSKPTCFCGECQKCRNRDAMRRHRERQRAIRNHKVVEVISAGVADVYCGDVDSVHNFAVVTSVTDGDALTGKLSGIISHNCIGGHEGYITVGIYADGAPGEIFLAGFGKDGSFIQCMMSVWAKALSNSLQYGQPPHKLVTNYLDMRFEPFGATTNPEIPYAKSIPDYIARWIALRFLSEEERELHGIVVAATA